MPGPVEMVDVVLVGLDVGVAEQLVEDPAVQIVKARPRQLTATHQIHRGNVAGPPAVGELGPIPFCALLIPELFEFGDDARTPVDDCAEHVEGQHADHGCTCLPADDAITVSRV